MDTSENLNDLHLEVECLREENEKLLASNRCWMRITGTEVLTGLPNRICVSQVYFTSAHSAVQ